MRTTLVLAAQDYARSRKAWLEARKSGLGASETAAVLGVDPWRTPLDVYLEKINPEVRDETVSEAAEWGSAIEAVVARKVSTRHPDLGKLIPSPGLCAHPDHPWMLATPDRILQDRETGTEAVLEIKTTDGRNRPLWEEGPPPRVLVQVQQQLAVLGLEVGYVAVLFGGREMPEPFEVKRDEEVIAQIVDIAGTFWTDHVLAQIPPEPRLGDDGNLLAMYPGDDLLDALVADDDLAALIAERSHIARRIKNHEQAVAEIDIKAKAALGDRTTLIDGDGRVLATWKPQNSTRLDSKRLKAEHPEIAKTYSTTTATRRFLIKETK